MRPILTLLLGLVLTSPATAQHPSIRAGEWLRVDFRARLQADVRASQAPSTDQADKEDDRLDIARRRVGIEGRAAKIFEYQVEYEFGAAQWRDVYIDYRQFKAVQLRAGAFKLPFGLNENTSATSLDFIYRSRISSRLAPGRDRGVSVHGRLANDRMSYKVGLFRHDGGNARPSNSLRVFGGRTGAARVTLRPFRGAKAIASNLHIGAAVAFSNVPLGFPAVRARTVFGASFFDSDVWITGRRSRTGLEARWSPGRVSVQSEYIRLTDERRGQSVEDGDLSPLLAHGWYVSTTYAVNARRARYGAIDVAARFETLSFGSTGTVGDPSSSARADRVRGNADSVVTCGASWQLNRWVKVQANLIREQLDESSMGPLPGRPGFWSRALRVQLAI